LQIKKYKKKFSIAVDGQSATGKSTGSKFISKYFDFDYLSSGKLYRYCAYILLKKKLNCNLINIEKIAKTITLEKLKGAKLYNKKVTGLSSKIAKKKYVRNSLKKFQIDFIKCSNFVICEGRDIGTKINPNADLKLFFKCSYKTKAKRRLKEFKKLNNKITLKEVEKALKERDRDDITRKISPLIKAKNAVLVDTTNLTKKQMEAKLIKLVKKSIHKKYGSI